MWFQRDSVLWHSLQVLKPVQTELAFNTCKECHKTESLWNHTTTDHKEVEQLEDRRNAGESSCNCGDGTDQKVQSLMFMMMMMMIDIQHTSFTYIFIRVRELDFNSLTKTKNWSSRNEVTETCGRPHPLWPQDKRLHKPRTTDYRHNRQDRWIRTELVSTLAKNATKTESLWNHIPLQTTRKESNWKTEETLERAVVTVETERIKGSNPWCLWWWWWWLINLRRFHFATSSAWGRCCFHFAVFLL